MRDFVENPRVSCSLSGALGVVGAIDRAIPIIHAGPGCGLQASIGTRIDYLGGGTGCPSTNTYEKEIVFGGEQRLRETIKGTLEVLDGDIYVVLTGCTAGIIGDDIDSVIREFEDFESPVIGVETAGFKGDTYYGYTIALTSILKELPRKTKKEEKTVNFFGLVPNIDVTANGDLEEIIRILSRIGVKVNTFFYIEDGIEQLKNSANASLNINISPWLLNGIDALYQYEFGIETLHYPGLPIGPSATSEFLRSVGSALDIDKDLVEKVIEEEESYVYRYFERAFRELYRFIIVGDVNTVLGYSRYFTNDIGLIPYVAIITDNIPEKKKASINDILNNMEYARKPIIYYEDDKNKIAEIIRQYSEYGNLVIGSSYEKEIANELGIFSVTFSYPCTDQHILNKTHIGYKGCLTVIEDMYNNL